MTERKIVETLALKYHLSDTSVWRTLKRYYEFVEPEDAVASAATPATNNRDTDSRKRGGGRKGEEKEEEEEENAPPAQTGRLATFRRFRAAALSVRFLFEGHAVCRFGFLFAETGRRGGVVWPRLGWGKGILVIPPFPSCQRDSSGLSLTILTPPPPCLPFPPCSIGRTDFIEKM